MSKSFTAYDVQKIRLEKLMTNIDKPVEIPQKNKEPEWKFPEAPDFVRNVMGSSAGAGSGEFHVYRHLRRKEFARQRFIEAQAKKEELDAEYRRKLEENKRILEEKTAKKRAKRLKKKQKLKKKKTTNPNDKSSDKQESQSEDESEKEETKEKSDEQQEEETKEKSDEQQEEETKE